MSARTLILGTAGHIDHGKTALVRALTGTDTDRLPQEKERGITIDIGFAALALGACDVGVVDVPGHERFIKNMLAGASSGIDVALLVVAADDSVMPQTREHLAILELLAVRHGVIAITKADLAEASWLDLVEEDVRALTKDTFLAHAPIVRTSATTGAGIDALKEALAATCAAVEEVAPDEAFRLAIDRVFAQPGAGTVVTGTVHSGRVTVGDHVDWLPAGRDVRVRALQSHDRDVETVSRGQRAAINLMGVHHKEARRGNEICTPGYLAPSRLLTVRLRVLPESPWPLKHRARLRLHAGTQEEMVTLTLLSGTAAAPGDTVLAQLASAGPVVATAGQPFVLRSESPLVTVGGGHVLQPTARRIARRDTATHVRLPDLLARDADTRVSAALRFRGGDEASRFELSRDAGVALGDLDEILARLEDAGVLIDLPVGTGRTKRLHRDALDDLGAHAQRVLEELHEAAPLEASMPRARVRRRLEYLGDDALLDAVLDRLVATGAAVGDERAVARVGFAPKLTGAQTESLRAVVEAFRGGAFSPPLAADLVKTLGVAEGEVRKLLDLCVELGELVHIGGKFYLHRDAEAELRTRVGAGLAGTSGRTMSEIKDLLGTSRKYALPMCEYLDRIGVTRRQGDVRMLSQ